MPTFVQLLVAVTVTGLLVGFDRPALLVVGAAAGVWPDFLAWVLTPLLPWPDLLVTPDPDRPDPATVTAGLRTAVQGAVAQGRPWRVRLNPVPVPRGPAVAYELDLVRLHTAVVRLNARSDESEWRGWLPRHPLPVQVAGEAVDLVLTPQAGGRIASGLAPVAHPAGHTWLWPPVWLTAALAYPEAALVAGVVTALHLALDYGSHTTLAPLWPVSKRITVGLRTWDGARRATVLRLGGVAALALLMAVLAAMPTGWIAAHPARALILAAGLTGLAGAGVRRLRLVRRFGERLFDLAFGD
jgi:hypothetical protein